MTTLQPRRIEPGYLWRWPKRALSLLCVNFHVWFALALAFCGVCTLFAQWTVLMLLLGVAFSFFSVEMAALSTRRMASPAEVVSALRNAGVNCVLEVWRLRYYLLVVVSLAAALCEALGALMPPTASEAVSATPDYASALTWLLPGSPLQAGAVSLLLASIVTGQGAAFGFVGYPLRQTFGVDAQVADLLRHRAVEKNLGAATSFNATETVAMLVCVVGLPGVAPLLLCLLPAVHFVAFKELFDPQGLPSETAPAQHPSLVAQRSNG